MFESAIKFTVECTTPGCTVRIEPSMKRAYCVMCEVARRSEEVDRVNRYHSSNAWGR